MWKNLLIYSAADVFLNTTLEDTFPTTNLESLACGTPVITFETGGSVESVSVDTGLIVPKGNSQLLLEAVMNIRKNSKLFYTENCRQNALKFYDKNVKFEEYLELYKEVLEKVVKTSCLNM